MNQLNTEREQRFVDLAAGLADEFAPRAAQHDEDASFPDENAFCALVAASAIAASPDVNSAGGLLPANRASATSLVSTPSNNDVSFLSICPGMPLSTS